MEGKLRLLHLPVIGAVGLSLWLLQRLPLLWRQRKQKGSKHAVVAEQQAQMRAAYDQMYATFGESGLDMKAIESMGPWYHGVDAPDQMPWPKLYAQVTPPMPTDAVRLLVLPYEECPTLAAMAAAAADIAKLLSFSAPGIKVFINARAIFHCTVFHTSHPSDLRPASTSSIPQRASSGHDQAYQSIGDDLQQQQLPLRTASDLELQQENDLVASCVAQAQPPRLKFERLVLAPSGVLLMTWTDPEGRIPALRSHLRQTFPNASKRQAQIIHSSLLRIVKSPQLPPPLVQAIQEKCDQWTRKIAGKTLTGGTMWWVREQEFSTITGERFSMKIGGGNYRAALQKG